MPQIRGENAKGPPEDPQDWLDAAESRFNDLANDPPNGWTEEALADQEGELARIRERLDDDDVSRDEINQRLSDYCSRAQRAVDKREAEDNVY